MRIIRLILRNYRNYEHLDLNPSPYLNVLLGANGQGKTNLLESVAMLALSSSPRARRDVELIGSADPAAKIQAEVESGGRTHELVISIQRRGEGARRSIEVDGRPRRALDLPGIFRVTLFWPDDLNMIKSGPEYRRRFLNQMLVQIQPGYAANLAAYSRALEQRNRLLKQIGSAGHPDLSLDVWDDQLAPLGDAIVAARRRALTSLAELAARVHGAISGEVMTLEYVGPGGPMADCLRRSRRQDLRRGLTSEGPHRDDVLVTIQGRDARAYSSQGQQRTAAISIKLAEAEWVEASSGEPPVLLLDDLLSELDGSRRRALLERLGRPGQVIITSVEADAFTAFNAARSVVRRIEAGRILDDG
ncbi:MAG TPA: DNA replication/repair protein RecF [Candidatus Acidoferrales bacterium]|nr:DNA replication/repair protein RecF [Candidatus Acidoferrales bacterium]